MHEECCGGSTPIFVSTDPGCYIFWKQNKAIQAWNSSTGSGEETGLWHMSQTQICARQLWRLVCQSLIWEGSNICPVLQEWIRTIRWYPNWRLIICSIVASSSSGFTATIAFPGQS